jgi:hypothetical protein
MSKLLIMAGAFALGISATTAMAGGTVAGAAGGAVTGAVIGGPIGAAVGGVAGAIVGTAIDPPPREVVTYVQQQPAPATAVIVDRPIVVGRAIPDDVEVSPVPDNPRYGYAIVNNQRVIVEPKHHTVVQVVQ